MLLRSTVDISNELREGASVNELREEIQKSLEVHFEVCEEQGKVPDIPLSDTIS